MLVICNGAVKSGSTWLYNILYDLKDFCRPPDEYLTDASRKRARNPCIRPDMLTSFLDQEDIIEKNYLSKNHIGRSEYRDQLIANKNVFIFDIERDVKDMVVSSYYDDCNRNGYQGSFSDYYWEHGRYLACDVIRYHDTWRDAGERFLMISYEELHRDFARQVAPIAQMLGVELDAGAIEALREKTSIGSLRKRYQDEELYKKDKFFRKGTIGDWENHFDDAITHDITTIQQKGIGPLDLRSLGKKVRRVLRRLSD